MKVRVFNIFGYEISIANSVSSNRYTALLKSNDNLFKSLMDRDKTIRDLNVAGSDKNMTIKKLDTEVKSKDYQINNLKKLINKKNKTIKKLLSSSISDTTD